MQGIVPLHLALVPFYFVFLDALCDKALPAAVFDFALVRPSRSTAEAADAARFDVCFEFFINHYLLLTLLNKESLDKLPIPHQNNIA